MGHRGSPALFRFGVCLGTLLFAAGLLISLGQAVPPDPSANPAAPPAPFPVPVSFGPDRLAAGERRTRGAIEPTIAVNPVDPANLVAGFIDNPIRQGQNCGFSYSLDGGQTWAFGGYPPASDETPLIGDPSLAADAEGNFYFAYFDVFTPQNGPQVHSLRVAKSSDGGRSFPTISIPVSGSNPDKELITVDAHSGSPHRGTIYLAYDDFAVDRFEIRVVVSRDGALTWSAPRILAAAGARPDAVIGAVPIVAADGTAYVFYAHFAAFNQPTTIEFSKSSDGGDSWSTPATVVVLPGPNTFSLRNESNLFGKKPFYGISGGVLPTAAVAGDGTLFVAWSDVLPESCIFFPGGGFPACSDSDVRLSVSRDRGATWSAPIKVHDDVGAADQFFPAIATHPNGLLSIVWQDKRLDPDNVAFDTFYTNTFDGVAFLPNVRVSTVTSSSGSGFSGDYIWVATAGDHVIPVWWDRRSGRSDIFSAVGALIE